MNFNGDEKTRLEIAWQAVMKSCIESGFDPAKLEKLSERVMKVLRKDLFREKKSKWED